MLRATARVFRQGPIARLRMVGVETHGSLAAASSVGPSSRARSCENGVGAETSPRIAGCERRYSEARRPRPPRESSISIYPLTVLHPSCDIARWPLLSPGTPECDEFAEKSKDGSTLAKAREAFRGSNDVLALSVPARESAAYRNHPSIKTTILHLPRIKALLMDPDDNQRRILLLNVLDVKDAPECAQTFLRAEAESERAILKRSTVSVDYNYWSTDEILSALLPLGLPEGTPTAFTSTGHLAHLNLREEYAAYRFLIGQVILDNNPQLRTVVNKLDTIDNEFRFFKMERLAGDEDYDVKLSESGCNFSFDFRTVYWNSRLHAEHDRLIRLFEPFDVVSDVMAGVGPFAVPSTKKGAYVLANDLNPASYESLKMNARNNRVEQRLQSFCQDGREFIRESIQRCWKSPLLGRPFDDRIAEMEVSPITSRARGRQEHERIKLAKEGKQIQDNEKAKHTSSDANTDEKPSSIERMPSRRLIDHFVMNLPGSALEFLDAYRGAYKAIASNELEAELSRRQETQGSSRVESIWPMVHVHCFTKDLDHPYEDICQRANAALGIAPDSRHALRAPPLRAVDAQKTEQQRASDGVDALSIQDKASAGAADVTEPTPELSLHLVRSVAPNKDMYCLSFRLTRAILFDELDT